MSLMAEHRDVQVHCIKLAMIAFDCTIYSIYRAVLLCFLFELVIADKKKNICVTSVTAIIFKLLIYDLTHLSCEEILSFFVWTSET